MAEPENELERLESRLRSVEERLSMLESSLGEKSPGNSYYRVEEKPQEASYISQVPETDEEKGLESQIGRFGLAWMGIIVLLFGIIFFTEYLTSLGNRTLSSVLGYSSVAVIYFIANYFRKSNANLSRMFSINGHLILFYITLRLHFFSSEPLISSGAAVIILLLLISGIMAYISERTKLQIYGVLAVLFLLFTAILSDSTHIMLPLITVASFSGLYFFYRNGWKSILLVTIILSYISFFLWMLSNPVIGHDMQLLADHKHGYIYLFAIGGCFSLLSLLRKPDGSLDDFIIGEVITNGILFTLLLIFVSVSYFKTDYVGLFAVLTVSCLAYSVVLKSTSVWNFASAFFALYGFMAMSISLYGMAGLPRVYLLLSVQSLVVVSMALWFRNRLMIIMNSLLFLLILIIYMFSSGPADGVNFSFALVSLVSARIINWKRERLEIKTDLIRNLYLIEGFVMVMFALYHAVPKQFVTLSWTMAAVLYFFLSFVLKNVKYRYMALGTMISAAVYLFIVDLARIEVIYRVLALLFLAIVSIGISVYYTNRLKKPSK